MTSKQIAQGYLKALDISEVKTLEDVSNVMKAHLDTFAFSSVKAILNENISLELVDIYEDIVIKRRGGYCFEHNKLLFEVLKELGFKVESYIARVLLDRDYMPPYTHRFTMLEYENEKYILDVGIGSHSPYTLIKFDINETTINHLGIEYKISQEDDGAFIAYRIKDEKPFIILRFYLTQCYDCDFELGHFYSHKHPNAVFVNNLTVEKMNSEVIYDLVNNKFSKFYKDKTEKIKVQNIDELSKILKEDFNLDYTDEEIKIVYDKCLRDKELTE